MSERAIHYKSSEELQQQLSTSNIYSALHIGELFENQDLLQLPAGEAITEIAHMKEENLYRRHELYNILIIAACMAPGYRVSYEAFHQLFNMYGTTQELDQYKEYTTQLRQCKRKISEKYTDLIPTERWEIVTNSDLLQGEIQLDVLETISEESNAINHTSFSEEELDEARKDNAIFLQLLTNHIHKHPKQLIKYFAAISLVFSREEIRDQLDAFGIEGYADEFLQEFSLISLYYNPEERKEVIIRAMKANKFNFRNFEHLGKPEILDTLTPEEAKTLAYQWVDSGFNYAYKESKQTFLALIAKKTLTEVEVQEIISQQIQNTKRIRDVFCFLSFFSAEDKNKFKKSILDLLMRTDDSANSIDLHSILEEQQGIMSNEDVQTILRHFMRNGENDIIFEQLELAEKLLPRNEIRDYIYMCVASRSKILFENPEYIKEAIEKKYFSEEEIYDLKSILLHEFPDQILEMLPEYMDNIPSDQRREITLTITKSITLNHQLMTMTQWINYITDDPTEQKKYIREQILKTDGFEFVSLYNESEEYLPEQNRQSLSLFHKLFTPGEIAELAESLDTLDNYAHLTFRDVWQVMKADKARFRSFLNKYAQENPYGLLYELGKLDFIYSPNEMKEFIEKYSNNSSGIEAALFGIKDWGKIIGEDYTWHYIRTYALRDIKNATSYIQYYLVYIPIEEREEFFHTITRLNPPQALTSDDFLPFIQDIDSIIPNGEQDIETRAFAPFTLTRFYEKIKNIPKDTSEYQTLLNEAIPIYDAILAIKNDTLEATYKNIQTEITTQEQEQMVLSLFHALSLCKAEDGQQVNFSSIPELENNLLEKLSYQVGVEFPQDSVIKQRFFETFSPLEFVKKYKQAAHFLLYKDFLKEILTHVIDGTYNTWRRSEFTPEIFNKLQELRYIFDKFTLFTFCKSLEKK